MGEIITFFSYKGGVGRTMALANVAVLLTQWDYKTLIVDWDLEAPGLENFFKGYIEQNLEPHKKGIIDIINEFYKFKSNPSMKPSWHDKIVQVRFPGMDNTLDLLLSGHGCSDYFKQVRNFDIKVFYKKYDGANLIEKLRNEWKQAYDFVLIDSRTGITDIGGICTIQFPDILVLLFTATEQSLRGIINVSLKAHLARQNMPFDRLNILSVPIPSRFDTQTEYLISQEWLNRFSKELVELYDDWLPERVKKRDILEITKIPYVSYFSFGEQLPVLDPGTIDPAGLGYAYETLSAILANKLAAVELLIDNRDQFIKLASKKTTKPKTEPIIRTKPRIKSAGPYIKRFRYDLFISYATVDDEHTFGEEKGWVTRFSESLKILLESRIGKKGIEIGPGLIEGEQFFDQTIKADIENSALFLALTSNAYLASDYCKKELRWFYQKIKSDPYGVKIGDRSRIYNILLNNIHYSKLPKEFIGISGYKFYDSKNDIDLGWPAEWGSIDYQKQLKSLADSIYKTLTKFEEIIKGTQVSNEREYRSKKEDQLPTIYFADVPDTLRAAQKLALNKLLQRGINILTNIPPPYKSKEHQEKVITEISKAQLSVHLLDYLPGREIDDEPGTFYPQKQAELGLDHANSQLIWIPNEIDLKTIEDDKYRIFLQSLEGSPRNRDSYEFIRGSKTSIAEEILDKIERIQSLSKSSGKYSTVLIDTHLKDQLYALELSNFLIERNFQPVIFPGSDSPKDNLSLFEEWLHQAKTLIILFGRVHESWVRERLTTALQICTTKNFRINKFCIFLAPPQKKIDEINLDFNLFKISLIDNSKSEELDINLLESFLK